MKKQPLSLTITLFFCCLASILFTHQPTAAADEQEGVFSIIWGDKFGPNPLSRERYFLSASDGSSTELALDEEALAQAGSLLRLNGRMVRVTLAGGGAGVRQTADGPVQVSSIAPLFPGDLQSREAAATGPQPWVTVMCKFADVAAEPKDLNYFLNMYSSSYPGLDHYWREASYNRANISGSTAHGWYVLPHPRSYYVNNNFNFDLITADCLSAANADIFFPGFVGINMMFNAELDGFAWGGKTTINIDGQSKLYSVTWEPPWGYRDITVIAHEMGHGFGMPHSSGNYGQTYDNVWDVMSNSWANCGAVRHPIYGCTGQQTIGYHRDLVGWLTSGEIYTFTGKTEFVTLERLTMPTSNNYLLAKVPIGGSASRYYTVELRKRVGYDTKLASEAVIIHQVDENRSNRRDAYIIDIDQNGNTGDEGAIWLPAEIFTDAANNICISVTCQQDTFATLKIGCNALPPPDCTGSVKNIKMNNTPVNHLLLR